MNELDMFDVLLDWNFWGNFKEEVKERENIPELHGRNALVIKGVRRCGKSSLSYLIAKDFKKEDILIINFEDPRLINLKAGDILKFLSIYQRRINHRGPKVVILDEVQNVDGWEKTVRLLLEAKKIRVIVTGSSSKLMSEEYATTITGRHLNFELFPLSFKEFLTWKGVSFSGVKAYKNKNRIIKELNEFLEYGGFPGVFFMGKKAKKEILKQYFEDILIKDVVKRFDVKEINNLENLAKVYLANISTLQSKNKLKNIVNLSADTIGRYSKYFNTASLFFFIPKFSPSVRKQILSVKKVYCIDSGMFHAAGFRFSKNIGRTMENTVAVELLRRRSYAKKDLELFYWKDYEGREVDFLVKEKTKIKQLIQVSFVSSEDEINERELKALIRASKETKCRDLILITWDYEDKRKIKNQTIKFIPLWRWLIS